MSTAYGLQTGNIASLYISENAGSKIFLSLMSSQDEVTADERKVGVWNGRRIC
jgi:hypothetical protein